MKDFLIEILGILVVLLGGAFFLKGKFKNPFSKTKKEKPLEIKPLPKVPDIDKIREEFKNETPKESADHVTNLLNELFPGD